MVLYFLFLMFIIPLIVLLHEVGHGLGVIIFSKAHAHIYLGRLSEANKENFRIGRMHFHIQWSYFGFASWDSELNRKQRACSLIGGPLMNVFLMFIFVPIAIKSQSEYETLFWWIVIGNLLQFLGTIIPMKYPGWMGRYSGYSSDGLQIINILKKYRS